MAWVDECMLLRTYEMMGYQDWDGGILGRLAWKKNKCLDYMFSVVVFFGPYFDLAIDILHCFV